MKSVKYLVRLLATTPEVLLEFLEDYALGQRIVEATDEARVTAAEAREV